MSMPILLLMAAIIAVFVILVATRSADFEIQRSVEIAAPPSRIYPWLNNLHHFDGWNPWAHLDPAMRKTYSGPDCGPGASYLWAGNNKVGEGSMTIVDAVPEQRVGMQLEFLRPMRASNRADFVVTPLGARSRVDWIMTGKKNFASKAFSMFVNLDRMVGKDFERGLVKLQKLAEAGTPPGGAAASDAST